MTMSRNPRTWWTDPLLIGTCRRQRCAAINTQMFVATAILLLTFVAAAGAKYSGGTGEPNDPYRIATAKDLMLLGETPEDYDEHFILTADIDLAPNLPGKKVFNKAVIAPDTVASSSFEGTPFTGVFDGNGHTISHLTVVGNDYVGMFGLLASDGEIKDLGVVDVNITGSGVFTGGLVGSNGVWGFTGGVVTRCYSTGVVRGMSNVGGLTGNTYPGPGIAWSPIWLGRAIVSQCYSTAEVIGSWSIGGLVGTNWGDVIHCYSTGAVTWHHTIEGTPTYVGGFVGRNPGGNVTASFWDTQTSGQSESARGTGKTTAEMHTASTFLHAGWDFVDETGNGTEDIWRIDEGRDYPELSRSSRRLRALSPDPPDGVGDVTTSAILSWHGSERAAHHDVYFGEALDLVADATPEILAIYRGRQTVEIVSYDPGSLELGKTYYWRIDEVNEAHPDSPWKGSMWSFMTEPVGYPIRGATIVATASSTAGREFRPENTINGSGLNADDLHSAVAADMWLSGNEPLGAWIQYEFDKLYKLHEMWVWNANQASEGLSGLGMKDVTVEYSAGGTDWTALGDVREFAKGSGVSNYAHNTTVEFGGAAAKYVRLTASTNWGGILPQYSLSEVRFLFIPVRAREPTPESGATDVDVEGILAWRAGRGAARHEVYIGPDPNALGLAGSVTQPAFDTASLGLALEQTYYWRVDEVNGTQNVATWQGDLWSFSTSEYLVVDDFESYNDIDPPDPKSHRIFDVWIDGFGTPTNGALVGDSLPPYAERILVRTGAQSMRFSYDNNFKFSEATRTLTASQDWTAQGVTRLSLWFMGTPRNTAQPMYVVLNGTAVVYNSDASPTKKQPWTEWVIPLQQFADLGVNLTNVTSITIGVGTWGNTTTAGGTGEMYFDDIRLYRPATP